MNWQINPKRIVREAITSDCCDRDGGWETADAWSLGFNSPLQEQTTLWTTEGRGAPAEDCRDIAVDSEDIKDTREALQEAGDRKDYEDFRRELGLD